MITFVVTTILSVLAVGIVVDFMMHPRVDALIYIAATIIDGVVQALCQGRAK